MNIMIFADQESKLLYEYYDPEQMKDIDLIISCGDLAPQFLSFMATFAKVPILYVHGNHDACYDETPPDGCICIDDDVYVHEGVRIAGLGGSMCYNFGMYQFTEDEMKKRVRKLRRKIKKAGGLDILITHPPAFELNDSTDLPHTGFQAFYQILDEYEPLLFAHGHVHINYGRDFKRISEYKNTKVVNAFEKYIIEI